MNRNFTILIFAVSSLFAASCERADSPNANANQTVIVSQTTAAANENTSAAKMPEEVPSFTDADEAVAAGDKYLDAVETENAINAYRQAVKLNADSGDAYFKLGIAYTLREKETEGEVEPETETEPTPTPKTKPKKTKKDAPPVPETDAEKAFDNAAKAYEKVLKKNPKDDAALYNLGRAYNKLNRDKDSEKALRLAVKLQPENSEYLTEFGSILMKLAQYDEAVTVLTKAVKFDDSNLHLQDLLEKAEAGKKRINFGIKPKPPEQQQQQQQQPTSNPKPTKPKPSPAASVAAPTPKPAATP